MLSIDSKTHFLGEKRNSLLFLSYCFIIIIIIIININWLVGFWLFCCNRL